MRVITTRYTRSLLLNIPLEIKMEPVYTIAQTPISFNDDSIHHAINQNVTLNCHWDFRLTEWGGGCDYCAAGQHRERVPSQGDERKSIADDSRALYNVPGVTYAAQIQNSDK